MKQSKLPITALLYICLGLYAPAVLAEGLEIDLVRLLIDENVLRNELSDGVHLLRTEADRQLFLVPHQVPQQIDQIIEVEYPDRRLSGGAFLTWYLPGVKNPQPKGSVDPPEGLDPTPSWFARDFQLHPDGTVHWRLERVLPRGSPGSADRLYAVKVHRSLQPERPTLEQIEGHGPEVAARRRDAIQTFREAQEQYKQYMARVQRASDDFSGGAPQVIYAVYVVPIELLRVQFTGDDPLPWSMPGSRFKQLRHFAIHSDNPTEWRPTLEQIIEDDHPYANRLGAAFLYANGKLATLDRNSLAAPAVRRVLLEGDFDARRTLVRAIEEARHPVHLAGTVLEEVMDDQDPPLSLYATTVRVKEAVRRRQPLHHDELDFYARTVNRLLSNAKGPDVEKILQPTMQLAAHHSAHLRALSGRLRIGSATRERRDEVIAAVLRGAQNDSLLAGQWLDHDLLNPSNVPLVHATLTQILAGPRPGETKNDSSKEAGRESKPIVHYRLDSSDHNLFKLLPSEDSRTREMAWQALRRFKVLPPPVEETSLTRIRLLDTYTAFARAATSLEPIPHQAVTFLREQPYPDGVALAMMTLLIRGSGDVRFQAMQYLAQQGPQILYNALMRMNPDDRQRVAQLWYMGEVEGGFQSEDETSVIVTGLLRRTDVPRIETRLVQWFAAQVAEGRRPATPAWYETVGDEEILLNGLLDPDVEFGLGCAAAILGTVMPPDEEATRRLRSEAMNLSANASSQKDAREKIAQRWQEIRHTMVLKRLVSMAGVYRVSIRTWPKNQSIEQSTTYILGRVQLNIDAGGKVSIKPKVPIEAQLDPLSLVMYQPQELADQFGGDAVNLVRLGKFPAVTLVFQPNRHRQWIAQTLLPDQSHAQMILTPEE